MTNDKLSFNTRKSLCNHLGDKAGNELVDFLQYLKTRVDSLEHNKVDIMKIVPDSLSAVPNKPR